jgi:hypothetical protein
MTSAWARMSATSARSRLWSRTRARIPRCRRAPGGSPCERQLSAGTDQAPVGRGDRLYRLRHVARRHLHQGANQRRTSSWEQRRMRSRFDANQCPLAGAGRHTAPGRSRVSARSPRDVASWSPRSDSAVPRVAATGRLTMQSEMLVRDRFHTAVCDWCEQHPNRPCPACNARRRRAVRLVEGVGLPVAEAAQRMGLSVGRVERLLEEEADRRLLSAVPAESCGEQVAATAVS